MYYFAKVKFEEAVKKEEKSTFLFVQNKMMTTFANRIGGTAFAPL